MTRLRATRPSQAATCSIGCISREAATSSENVSCRMSSTSARSATWRRRKARSRGVSDATRRPRSAGCRCRSSGRPAPPFGSYRERRPTPADIGSRRPISAPRPPKRAGRRSTTYRRAGGARHRPRRYCGDTVEWWTGRYPRGRARRRRRQRRARGSPVPRGLAVADRAARGRPRDAAGRRVVRSRRAGSPDRPALARSRAASRRPRRRSRGARPTGRATPRRRSSSATASASCSVPRDPCLRGARRRGAAARTRDALSGDRHRAEELYVPLAGAAEWQRGNAPFALRRPGEAVFHAQRRAARDAHAHGASARVLRMARRRPRRCRAARPGDALWARVTGEPTRGPTMTGVRRRRRSCGPAPTR